MGESLGSADGKAHQIFAAERRQPMTLNKGFEQGRIIYQAQSLDGESLMISALSVKDLTNLVLEEKQNGNAIIYSSFD